MKKLDFGRGLVLALIFAAGFPASARVEHIQSPAVRVARFERWSG